MRKRLAVHVKKAVRGCLCSYQRAYLFDSINKKKAGIKISRAIAHGLLCNWIWEYVNVQAVSMPLLPTSLAHRWPMNREILAGRREGGWLGGRRWGSLKGDSFLLPKLHKGLDIDLRCAAEMSTPAPPLSTPTTFPSFSPVALSSHHPSLVLHLPSPCWPPALRVQPLSLSNLSCWIGISREGMDAVSLNWVKWGDDSGQWSHTLLPFLSRAGHSINMLRDRGAANANRCLL